MKKNKAYRYRIYPDEAQRIMISKTIGCARFIYNRMLDDKIAYYSATKKMLHNTPAEYKEANSWLREVDSLALANAQLELERAYANFFRDESVGFPAHRKKHGRRQSYTTNNQNGTVRIEDGRLRLPKISGIKIRMHRQIPEGHIIKSATVSAEPSGKYYVSILTEYDAEKTEITPDPERSVGLDYSSSSFYVTSEGERAEMPHFYRKVETKLKREQRKLSKMTHGSSNWEKQKKALALLNEKIMNQRRDWQHKKSKELAERYDIVCIEEIDLKNISQGLKLGKSTYDNGFGQFRRYLEYKLEERGKKLIMINKWYPSSRKCHVCGYVNKELTLKDRQWLCPECGTDLDRDINAAINIRNEGLQTLFA